MLTITYLGECRLPEPQICRPMPRKPAFLMESLTREGLNVAAGDMQPSQTRYLLEHYTHTYTHTHTVLMATF